MDDIAPTVEYFEAPESVFPLDFSGDPLLKGLQVNMRRPSIMDMADTMRLSNINTRDMSSEDIELIGRVFNHFIECLVSWNLTKKGKTIPATEAGVRGQEDTFILMIILVWVKTLTGQGIDPATIPMEPPD